MAYEIKSVTIRANNSEDGMRKIAELWQDLAGGRLPLLFDSEHQLRQGISPVSKYSNYESDEHSDYDLTILAVTADFFAMMEKAVGEGRYKKYEAAGEDLGQCAKKAWADVWNEGEKGMIQRAYTEDFESTVPAEYTKDGKAHCYLYIAVI